MLSVYRALQLKEPNEISRGTVDLQTGLQPVESNARTHIE